MSVGVENLNIISNEAYEQVQETMRANSAKIVKGEGKKAMTVQQYQFEAQMRSLDAQVCEICLRPTSVIRKTRFF